MSLQAFALIILAGIIHAGWNIAAKKAGGDARFAFFTSLLLIIVWAPLAWWVGRDVVPHWGWQPWAWVAVSGVEGMGAVCGCWLPQAASRLHSPPTSANLANFGKDITISRTV